jgi:purine-binding chemotaxis protein CheW
MGARLKSGIIRGMGKRDNALIMILDIDKVFTYDELAIARDMTGAAAE